MNREFNYSNPQSNTFHPNTISNRFQEDWNVRSPENKNNIQSDLYIFNGDQPVKDIYHQENNTKSNLAFVPQKVNKNPSQKAFPIIYNTYNESGVERQNKIQNINSNPVFKSNQNKFNDYEEFNQRSHSNISQKSDNYHRQEAHNQFHTFQRIPEHQPQTAKFLNLPPQRNQNANYLVPHDQYLPQQQRFESKQISPPINYQPQIPINTVIHQPVNTHSHNKSASRIIQVSAPPTPKPIFQQSNQIFINYSEQKARVIQIPQQQYERYVDHLPQCRRNQEQNVSLKNRAQQLIQKQRFYWQQNMTLRQQNKRLRDLVTHFQKRQKQLMKKNEQQTNHFDQQIIKYRESTLQQFILLMERYKLQLQKKK